MTSRDVHTARRRSIIASAGAVWVCLIWPGDAGAVPYLYWDTNGSAAGSTNGPSTGTWDFNTTLNHWNTYNDGLNHVSGGVSSLGKYFTVGGGAGKVAVFNAGGDTKADPASIVDSVTLTGTVSALGMIVKDGSLTLSGGPGTNSLQLYSEGIEIGPTDTFLKQAAGKSSIGDSVGIDVNASQTWQNNIAQDFSVASAVRAGGTSPVALTLNAAAGGNILLTGPISNGTGSNAVMSVVVKSDGNGTVTLGGANSYTGKTTLTAGKVIVASPSGLGNVAAGLVIGTASLDIAADSSIAAYDTTITGNATILSDRATAGSGVSHTLGSLKTGGNTITVGSGANVIGGVGAVAFGATTLTGSTTFNVVNSAAATTTLSLGPIGQSGVNAAMTKTGSGTITLSGANTFTGRTTVSAGTLRLASGASLASGVTLAGPAATLDPARQGGNVALAGLDGVGGVQLASGQKLTLTAGSYLGAPGVADTLTFSGGGSTGGLDLSAGANFDVDLAHYKSDTVSLAGQTLGYNDGVLNITLTGAPASDQTYPLFAFAQYTGRPAAVVISGLTGPATADYDFRSGLLTVTLPEPSLVLLITGYACLARRHRRA